MNTYDFIFSRQLRYRIIRHVSFWFCWFVYLVFLWHIPMTDVFPNWDVKARMDFSLKKNGVDFITLRGGWANLIWEVSYKQFRILLCHMAFTYTVIYYILPLYISGKRKWITTGKLLSIFIAFLALHYFIIYRNLVDNKAEWAKRVIYTKTPVKMAFNHTIIINMTRNHVISNISALVAIAVAIKLLKRWWVKQKETEQAAKVKISAELQLLKAQIHPHFLFNSLNNIYSFALEASPKAPEMIKKLSGLLHYMLYECKQDKVLLTKELMMINDYISLEKIRYGERLKIDIHLPKDNDHQIIAPLLLIPFVENSFKHGTSKMLSNPYVRLNITVQGNILYFKLTNSRPVAIEEIAVDGNRGLGLKRLELLYPKKYELQIMDDPSAYSVWMKIDMADETPLIKKDKSVYELA
jgi:hypothetical protein